MNRYILNQNIALRSWQLVPYAYYIKGIRNAKGLKKDEFEILLKCDGKTELDETSPLVKHFTENGFISPIKNGNELSKWQRYLDCDNRYFPAINWMITGKCNYNCLHCFNAADNAPSMNGWTLEEAKKLTKQAQECGINAFTVTGGEPMVHRDFFEIIKSIYANGMYVDELNTNGYFLDKAALDKFREIGCNPLIKISFDGLGHHDWLRNRKGAETDALHAIRLCIENGFTVKAQTNVHRLNVDSMLSTAYMLDEMGVEEMRIIRTTESPRWKQNAGDSCMEIEEYYQRMLEFTESYIKTPHQMKIDIWQFLTLFPQMRSYRMRPIEFARSEYRDSMPVCRGNRGMVAVAVDGNVYPCMQMSGYYSAKNDYLGNVKMESLRSILQKGKYLNEVCATLGDLSGKNEKCAKCLYFRHCGGGCRALALALTGDKFGVDPAKCTFFRNGWYGRITETLCEWKNIMPMEVG